jgi:hypothetical protein
MLSRHFTLTPDPSAIYHQHSHSHSHPRCLLQRPTQL